MAYGLPPGLEDLLRKKYSIQQQQADAVTTNAQTNRTVGEASAALDRTRNQFLPDQARADIAATKERTRLTGQQADYFGRDVLSQIALRAAQGGLYRAQGENVREGTVGLRQNNRIFQFGAPVFGDDEAASATRRSSGPRTISFNDANAIYDTNRLRRGF